MADTLRVIDFGTAGPLRSQTLWHAVARGVSDGAPPTLSFVRPSAPYVCLGYHRRLDEVDLAACDRLRLPVYRRMVGGGPVYLDPDQLFFQICLPVGAVPVRRDLALRHLLGPAVDAFRAVGVPAELDRHGEIVVGDRKVCGHGAGQIDGAVVVVGNLIERFDHQTAVAVLRMPSPDARRLVLRLMRRYVAATPCDVAAFRATAVRAYAGALGLEARPGGLSPGEDAALGELDREFEDPSWLAGPDRVRRPAWEVKVRAGVWAFEVEHAGARVRAGVVGGRLEAVQVSDAELNGAATTVAAALDGRRLADAPGVLSGFGGPGRRLGAALAGVEGRLV